MPKSANIESGPEPPAGPLRSVSSSGSRDFEGYGQHPPDPKWPGDAYIAVSFNLNYEAGGEKSILDGDEGSEATLNDTGNSSKKGVRSPYVESVFEYGARVGAWRILRIFNQFEVPISVFVVAKAIERNTEFGKAIVSGGHEVVSHGYRWLDYHFVDEATERSHIARAVETIERVTGETPVGWFTGRPGPNTRRLLVEHGGFLYDRDSQADELPFWTEVSEKPHLVIPYSFDTNDNHFNTNHGFSTGEDFFQYMKDAFELLYEEGKENPRLLSIGLHDRLIGRPARASGLIRFLEHVRSIDRVWFCRGVDVARHWQEHHPYGD